MAASSTDAGEDHVGVRHRVGDDRSREHQRERPGVPVLVRGEPAHERTGALGVVDAAQAQQVRPVAESGHAPTAAAASPGLDSTPRPSTSCGEVATGNMRLVNACSSRVQNTSARAAREHVAEDREPDRDLVVGRAVEDGTRPGERQPERGRCVEVRVERDQVRVRRADRVEQRRAVRTLAVDPLQPAPPRSPAPGAARIRPE